MLSLVAMATEDSGTASVRLCGIGVELDSCWGVLECGVELSGVVLYGMELDPSGIDLDPSGMEVDPCVVELDPSGVELDPCGTELDPSGMAL